MLVTNLPPDSASARKAGHGADGWDVKAYLLADLYHVWAGNPHPARPQPKKASRYSALRSALEQQKARLNSTP